MDQTRCHACYPRVDECRSGRQLGINPSMAERCGYNTSVGEVRFVSTQRMHIRVRHIWNSDDYQLVTLRPKFYRGNHYTCKHASGRYQMMTTLSLKPFLPAWHTGIVLWTMRGTQCTLIFSCAVIEFLPHIFYGDSETWSEGKCFNAWMG